MNNKIIVDNIRPSYEGLNERGDPYIREARVISELKTPEARMSACVEATATIATLIGKWPTRKVMFGTPVYEAFMTRAEAIKHERAKLLMTCGGDISLEHCPNFWPRKQA